MGLTITGKKCFVREELSVLEIHLEGETEEEAVSGRIRLMAVFCDGEKDRRFPLSGCCELSVNGKRIFHVDAEIELKHVFFEYQPAGEVSLEFQYCDPQEGWVCLGQGKPLPPELFAYQIPSKGGIANIGKILCYLGCTLLLPLWLIDGMLAVRGKRPLHPAAREWKGKKAVIYHAHGLVHEWTGYGYSLREIKTGYFKWQYERFCQKISNTEGVLFLSEREVDLGGNLDRIRDRLREDPSLQIREFLVEKPVHKLKFRELKRAARLLAGARVVILEDFYPQLHALSIRPGTRVLQLWHACGAFKLFGLSELGIVPHLEQSTPNHRNYSAAICSGTKLAPFYSEAFGVPESAVRPVGVPRTDIFFEQGYRERTKERLFKKYPVLRGRRVILFAPTFRGSGNKTANYPMDRFPAEELLEILPSDVMFVVKNHPFVKDQMHVGGNYSDRLLDVSNEENVNDLLFVAAALITDYSSVIFEAALLRLPMLFYAFDLEDYLQERDLYFDFTSFAPGEIVQQKEELADGIRRLLEKRETERYAAFCDFFLDSLDGKSTERTTQLVYELLRCPEICLISNAAEKRKWRQKCRLLWQQIFGDSDSYLEYYEQYKWKDNLVLLCLWEDEIVSMLHLNPYDILWGGKPFRLHYIAGVCTREKMRGRGYMGNLLTKALHIMYQHGEPWTYLMPVSEKLYTPYDFVPVYRTARRVWTCEENSPVSVGAISYRSASAREREALVRFVSGRLSQRFSVFTLHDEAYFEERAQEAAACGGDVLILGQEERVTGYVQYLSEFAEKNPPEIVEMVSEAGWEQENMAAIGQYLGENKICLEETCFLGEPGGERCVIMARIVCAEAFLRWAKRPAQWKDTVYMELQDDRIEENNGVWKIVFREKDNRGNLVEKTGQKPEVSYTVSQAAELFLADQPVYINEMA